MAFHFSRASMLKESLPEFVEAARLCVTYIKDEDWEPMTHGGCLGFPACALMFSVVDSIGSYHRGREDFRVLMDDQFVSIEKQSHHFYILNSQYYDLALPGRSISKLRQNYRDLLLHNAVIADQHVMGIGNPEQEPFLEWRGRIHINVPAFLRVTERAVLKFLSVVDTVVPGSDQERVNALKR